MGSDKRNGREDRFNNRPSDPRRRRTGLPFIESLEDRRMLTGWVATSTDPYNTENGPLANLGTSLIDIYKSYNDYLNSGSNGAFTTTAARSIEIQGTNVKVSARGVGDFNAFQQSLTGIGMKITATSPATQTVEGFIPIANLYKLATSPQINGASPIYNPIAYFKGIGNNQSDQSLNANVARTTYGVDGTGQKIGAISTSVDEFSPGLSATNPNNLGGLKQSVSTGDLPNNVIVVSDAVRDPKNPEASSDEGRAMLEQVYDIAPGAQLSFASAYSSGANGTAGFASVIDSLAAIGDKTIVDDIGILNDPAFQASPITAEIDKLAAQNVTYLSSAGNSGDGGYLSQFRGVNATVAGIGAGRYMNFDPTGATQATTLGVVVAGDRSNLVLQFDQPFGQVTSNLEFDLISSAGNVIAQTTSNTFAQGEPVAAFLGADGGLLNIPAGQYSVAVRVLSGSDPGHIFMYTFGGDVGFDQHFGSAGGTYYPTTFGHNAAPNGISVGAVPFWGTTPFESNAVTVNEPYSSFGPVLNEFNLDGSAKTPTLLQKPDISATDANNTSFFIPGIPFFNTAVDQIPQQPVFPGNTPQTFLTPKTATNDLQALPYFTGTSAAAPNLAAVVVLMKQLNPTATNSQILSALTSTASPLDGSAKGTWNRQGGFGLANAVAALQAVSTLQVNSISPGSAQTITSIPYGITVNFSKPVDIRTLSASSLQVAGPNGATVTVMPPVGIDSSTFPTQVRFSILINAAPGKIANGIYITRVAGGTIKGQDGTTLQTTFTDTFNLQQTVAPTVARTNFLGRVVSLTFATSVNPASVTPNNVYLFRAGGVNNPLFNPNDVLVSRLPGAVFSYNPSTWTVTIDLSNVAQSQLPTDQYALVASSAITDQVGNPLNGAFNGVFPSGIFPSASNGTNFVQSLGVVNLPAPVISALVLAPNSDSGVQGDSDTNVSTPSFVGQVTALFPNTNVGLQVYAQFNGISHPGVAAGGLNLGIGANGRGVVGEYDVVTTTDANGRFVINYPAGISPLPEGQNIIRAVVVGATDAPPAGLSASIDTTFQIDRTLPYVGTLNGTSPTSIVENASINNLSTLSISVVDPVNPASLSSPFAVNAQTRVLALNPATSNATGNYILDLITPTGQVIDESSFLKGATFVSTSARVLTTDPFTGRVDLAFGPGLPQGRYVLTVKGQINVVNGVTDQAGNPITNSAANSATGTASNFVLDFNLQPTPTYITNYAAYSDNGQGNIYGTTSAPRASYEIPAAGATPGAPAPPTAFTLDFSNRLDPTINYTNLVEVVRSADSATAKPDGDFGNFGTPAGLTNPTGFTRVAGISVQLVNSISTAVLGQPGYQDRLFITLPAGSTLPADYYRVYLPNVGTQAIKDVFGNQLDGEFLGYQNAAGKFINQLNTGQVRGAGTFEAPDLTGDGTPGGAFVTGFVVVPNGNVIYARPDAIYNPQLPGTFPDGTQARPYPVLAPEATTTPLNNGDLNSVVNSGVNFNPVYDRSGLGTFQPSAFFAAQEKARITQAPVVIVAEPALLTRDPLTGIVTQRPFVLQAPATTSNDPIANDGSAAVPAMTTLLFAQGSTLKMQNAALLVQNQGSSLQIEGGPNPSQLVNITSYKDSSIGGATNGDPSSLPVSGDYGGILFRNFNQAAGGAAGRSSLFPGQTPITGSFASDGRLKGAFTDPNSRTSQLDAISGADPVMSYINFLVEKYAGGTVPQTFGTGYDGITLQNSRPTIVNSTIALAGVGSASAGVSADFDSLLKDDTASGPLLRGDALTSNNFNGIYIRGQLTSGVAEPTTATITNKVNQQYILNDPYPYVLTTPLNVGNRLQVETSGVQINSDPDRLYITPGSIVKFQRGAGINLTGGPAGGSLNIGDATYINEFDANPNFGPSTPGFRANSANLASVILTSLYDDAATTTYTDPNTGITQTVTPALPSIPGGAGANLPSAGNTNVPAAARWAGVNVAPDTVAVINSAVFRYGGGQINTPGGTGTEHVLEIGGAVTTGNLTQFAGGAGARISVTNNSFTDNLDVPINLAPDSLQAGDPTRPLLSGDPFIHGNTFQRNEDNAVGVQGGALNADHEANVTVNSTWTGSDFTYLVRDTIVVGPVLDFGALNNAPPPPPNAPVTTPNPSITLTLQSTLPGTVLADGTVVAAPGVPLVIKLKNNNTANTPPIEATGVTPGASTNAAYAGGAGFVVGVDDGTDPPTPLESYIDNGYNAQIRILGIPGNQSTGQTRVPVTITSIYDNSVGTTVNGIAQNQVVSGSTVAPQAGDGGVIYFGGNSLTTYNFQDLRSGSVINNADISYITRIEQQGGGVLYTQLSGTETAFSAANDDPFSQKVGLAPTFTLVGGVFTPLPSNFYSQYNQPKKLTIQDSNLSTFSDGGVVAHPGFPTFTYITNGAGVNGGLSFKRTSVLGEPTQTYLVNDTISNMTNTNPASAAGRQTGLQVISEIGADGPMNGVGTTPSMAIVLNTTFYNDTVGINIVGDPPTPTNPFSHVALLAFDSIFDNPNPNTAATANAITGSGQVYGSESQNNLFFGYTMLNEVSATSGIANNQPINGDPKFRNAAAGNFNLLPTSAAINQARSELGGPSIFGDMLYPAATINTANLNALPIRNFIGDLNYIGGYQGGRPGPTTGVVALPGLPISTRSFPDQWIPTLVTAAPGQVINSIALTATTPGTAGNGFNASTYGFTPLQGQRDILGNLRGPQANAPNPGSGVNAFIDLGAYQYITQNPPLVESVTATAANSSTTSNLYVAGGLAGINQYPSQISVGINERLNPATITPNSVQLIGSGGDGLFGNANDINYNLANRLSFNNNGNLLIINTAGLFTQAQLNDEFQLVLKGTGPSILRDNNGLALDGNTNNNTAPLPSGVDQFPGSDFSVLFTISTHSPSLVSGTFGLAPGSFKTASNTATPPNIGAPIVNNNKPTFVGQITDIFPPANPLQGDQVFVDISTTGNPNNFDILGAATGVTNATGNFSVTVAQALPDSPWAVGPDGVQGTKDDTGTSLARVRVVNAAGNQSILPTDPFSSFINAGAAFGFQVDTVPPKVTALTPASGTLATPNASGQVIVSATFTKNIDPTTLNATSVLVTRAGGTGNFTGAGIAVPIVAGSFNIAYLGTPKGAVTVTFALQGPLPNDFYRITLKGTGATPIRDVAGNALDGAGTGVAGSGDFTNQPFTVFSPGNARLIYVDINSIATGTTNQGSRANPYKTIAAGLAAAQTGDDVLVLPGTYRERVSLKSQVRLLSASPSSTDAGFTPGNALSTIIYGVAPVGTSPFGGIVVTAQNLTTIPGVPTELSGFTILAPLLGDNVRGPLDTTSVGVALINANVLVDKNYIINAGIGVNIGTTGTNVSGPMVLSNVIVGNFAGVGISDQGSTSSYTVPTEIINNTIADNTLGVYNVSSNPGVLQAYILNDIFYSNHDLSSSRNGTAIQSGAANTLNVGSNLFFGNGVSGAPSSNASGTFVGFNPALLSSRPDTLGNILGDPFFVSARDPRPNGDTPPVFFLYANYDLTSRSPAINGALNSVAPTTDILYRRPVSIPGKGINGSGPASIGAFYYLGTTGTGTGGGGTGPVSTPIVAAFRTASTVAPSNASMVGGGLPIGTRQLAVVNTSLNPDGTTSAAPGIATSLSGLTSIDVNFSNNLDESSVQASDLILTGSGLNPANPAKATGLTWVDGHTVRFLLTGGFNSTGSVNLSIPQGAIKDTQGDSIAPFAEDFLVASNSLIPAPTATAQPSVALPTTVALPTQPVAVAGPIAVHYTKHLASAKSHHAKSQHTATTTKTHTHPKTIAAKTHPAKHGKATK